MTKSELIERLATQQSHIPAKTVEDAVKEMLEHMASTLAQGERIEIRGFGSFSLHYRAPRTGRNPKTGDKVELEGKYVPHFKPGKELRDRANITGRRWTLTTKPAFIGHAAVVCANSIFQSCRFSNMSMTA